MKPGRELDALIAEKVLGEDQKDFLESYGCPTCGYDGLYYHPKQYSNDIAAAWEVLEKHIERNWFFEISGNEDGTVQVILGRPPGTATSKSISHAICLAALKAVGVEV